MPMRLTGGNRRLDRESAAPLRRGGALKPASAAYSVSVGVSGARCIVTARRQEAGWHAELVAAVAGAGSAHQQDAVVAVDHNAVDGSGQAEALGRHHPTL